jgi:Tfp pilus assembly protein PilF
MPGKETITVFDQQGRPREIPRAEFMDKALPKLLEAAWNDPNQLYQQIVFALNEGMHAGVVAAAKRLDELDQGRERGRVMLSATQFQNGQVAEAEATLRECIAKHGESAVTLVNLARIRIATGDAGEAEGLVDRALELDPNQENALGMRCQALFQSGGDAAVHEFLEAQSSVPGRWRAQLWLAQQRFKGGDAEGAVELLRGAGADLARDPGALLAASAELGKAGRLAEMVDLVLPLYDERRQRPETGFNVMQGLLQLQRLDEARALHARMAALKLPPLAGTLAHFAKQLGIGGAAPAAPPAVPSAPGAPAAPQATPQQQPPQQIEVRLFVVDGPLWMQGLSAPWLGPEKDAKARRVSFVAFCDESLANVKGKPRVDEETGKLTRAFPMYLCEAVHLRTSAKADMVVPLLPGGAFVVTGQLWPVEALLKGRPDEQKPDYLVQGILARDEGGLRIELVIFDRDGKEAHRLRAIGLRQWGGQILRIENELLGWLESQGIQRTGTKGLIGKLFGGSKPRGGPDTTARPATEHQDLHLDALASLLQQALPAIGLGSRENLPDEQALLESCLRAARGERTGSAKAIAACSVMFALRYGSTHAEAAKEELAKMIQADNEPEGVLRMLSPGLYLRMGRKEDAVRARGVLKSGHGDAYRKWIESLEQA